MTERISKLAAFVFENGAFADEILFRDVDEDGELQGIRPEEREAMDRVQPHLDGVWKSLLLSAREALWKLAQEHEAIEALRSSRMRDETIVGRGEVEMTLVSGKLATCGICLATLERPKYELYVWVWTRVSARSRALAALASVDGPTTLNSGSIGRVLGSPKEGELVEDLAQKAAAALWQLARPVAEALSSRSNPTP